MRAGLFIVAGLIAAIWPARADEKLPVLKVGINVYSNVTVTTVTPTDIYFTCAGGIGNAKLKQLSPELQQHFGYNVKQAGEVEGKHAQANAQYRNTIIQQPAAQPSSVDSKNEPSATVSGTYGDVLSKYRDSTVTKSGDVAPLASLHTIDNRNVDFQGKVVILDFFATWCGPCMEEMPYVENNLWRQFKDKGLIVIAVGRGHSASEVEQFQKKSGYSFLFAADPKDESYRKFATQYIPRCVLIGKDGRIKFQTAGFSSDGFNTLIKAANHELRK
jgi:thiol-disulfide isomerase/thioredoxin